MGGAGLAYGLDGAAPFLNPATVVRIDEGRLTFSVNFYSLTVTTAPRWYQPGAVDRAAFGDPPAGDTSLADASFDALPSSLCLFFRAGEVAALARAAAPALRARAARLGLCFATVQSHEFNFTAQSLTRRGPTAVSWQGQTVSQSFTRFAAGPTYAMNVDDSLALGASLHASLASYRSVFAASATSVGGAAPVSSVFYAAERGTSAQVDATVGATYRVGRQTLALAFTSPSLHLRGTGGANEHVHFEGAGSAAVMRTAKGSFVSRTPARVGVATGIEASWGAAELDASFHAPTTAYEADFDADTVTLGGGQVSERREQARASSRARGVVNLAAGAEIFVLPSLSVLAGVGTDLGAARPSDPHAFFPTRGQRVLGSFGIGSHGAGGDLLVGGEVSYAWGDMLAVNSYQLPPAIVTTPQETVRVVLVVAGSTSLRAIRRAVEDVTRVLEPKPSSPKKAPAR